MSNILNLKYQHDFTSTDVITVQHDLNSSNLAIQIIINGKLQLELVERIEVDKSDPKNKFKVYLSSVSTGRLQIIKNNFLYVNQPTLDEKVSFESALVKQSESRLVPNTYPVLGTYTIWGKHASIGEQSVVYEKIFLPQGSYTAMEVGLKKRFSNSTLQMGVYANDPINSNPSGSLLCKTSNIDISSMSNQFVSGSLDVDLVVSTGGEHYWLACITNGKSSFFSSNQVFNKAWKKRFYAFQSSIGQDTLPSSVGTLDSEADSALIYMAIVKSE